VPYARLSELWRSSHQHQVHSHSSSLPLQQEDEHGMHQVTMHR
jgi:hypothetical protein